MAGANKGGLRLAGNIDQMFFKGYPLITDQDGQASADGAVAGTDYRRHVLDLITIGFAFMDGAAQQRERFQEKGSDKVRLKTAGLGALHVFTDGTNAGNVHGIV